MFRVLRRVSASLALQAMEADGVRADKQLLGALIRALGAGGLVDEAQAVFRTMVRPHGKSVVVGLRRCICRRCSLEHLAQALMRGTGQHVPTL